MAGDIVAGTMSICKTLHRCIVCGAGFYPKRTDRRKCCGRECGTAFNGMQATLKKTGGRVSVIVLRKKCPACGKRHSRRGPLCSNECRRPAYIPMRRQKDCVTCSKAFVPSLSEYGNVAFCSDVCRCEAQRSVRKAAKARRKAAVRGSDGGETVNSYRVFQRDGWRCQICMRKVDKAKRGTSHPRAPELDHIVPVSKGGPHTYANTQCACRECNGKKGATVFGQLNLFPSAA